MTVDVADQLAPLKRRLLLTYAEAAEALNISQRSVWQAVSNGNLRAVRIGRSVRIAAEDLADFVRRLRGK